MKSPPSVAGENNSPRSEEEKEMKEKKGRKGRKGRKKGRKKTKIRKTAKIAKRRCPLKLSENSLWNTRSSSQSLGQAR